MKKGFTLIELLGVIIILAIIMSIVTVVMINIINNTHKTIDESTLKILYAQATEYINEEYVVPANGDFKVTLKTLRENNKIKDTFIETINDDRITESSCVEINVTNGEMNYEFSYECN